MADDSEVQAIVRCDPDLLAEFDDAARLDERSRAAALRVAMRRYIDDTSLAPDADVIRVLEYVSRGRRAVDVGKYPDALARRALGRLLDRSPGAGPVAGRGID